MWFFFSLGATEKWTAISDPFWALNSDGSGVFDCCVSFSKHQVQCLVHRLHSQALGQVFLHGPNFSSPFLVPTHTRSGIPVIVKQCALEKQDLGVFVPSLERKDERSFDGQIDRFIVICKDHTSHC